MFHMLDGMKSALKKILEIFKKLNKYDFYFDHSYALMNSKYSLGVTNHAKQFSSIIQKSNILACQFHPEKSQENGLNFLKVLLIYMVKKRLIPKLLIKSYNFNKEKKLILVSSKSLKDYHSWRSRFSSKNISISESGRINSIIY